VNFVQASTDIFGDSAVLDSFGCPIKSGFLPQYETALMQQFIFSHLEPTFFLSILYLLFSNARVAFTSWDFRRISETVIGFLGLLYPLNIKAIPLLFGKSIPIRSKNSPPEIIEIDEDGPILVGIHVSQFPNLPPDFVVVNLDHLYIKSSKRPSGQIMNLIVKTQKELEMVVRGSKEVYRASFVKTVFNAFLIKMVALEYGCPPVFEEMGRCLIERNCNSVLAKQLVAETPPKFSRKVKEWIWNIDEKFLVLDKHPNVFWLKDSAPPPNPLIRKVPFKSSTIRPVKRRKSLKE